MAGITPFLWYDGQAELAAQLYVSIFPNSRIVKVDRYPEGSPGGASGVMTVEFTLNGQKFIALNGGPMFQFTEAVSFSVGCETQEELDWYWSKLSEGGEESMCGWLKDRFGLSWQVTPRILGELLSDPDPVKSGHAMQAMLRMKKIIIADLTA